MWSSVQIIDQNVLVVIIITDEEIGLEMKFTSMPKL